MILVFALQLEWTIVLLFILHCLWHHICFPNSFGRHPAASPFCTLPDLADVFVCASSAPLEFWCTARFCLLASAAPKTQQSILLQPCVLSCQACSWKPGLNPNPCYSLGSDEGVGSLRAQIFKFLQCIKTFKGLMYLDPNQHTTLVVLCQGKALMDMACEKEGTKRKYIIFISKSKVMLGKSNSRCHSR